MFKSAGASVGVGVGVGVAVGVAEPTGVGLGVADGVGVGVGIGVGAGSSLRIVPVPCAFAIWALGALLRLTKKVSSGSKVVSPLTSTVIVFDVSLGLKVSVLLVA